MHLFEIQGSITHIIDKIFKIVNIYLYNPITLINDNTVEKYLDNNYKYMFKI